MFTVRQSALVAGFATLVAASPLGKRDLLPYDENVQIHESCNTTQRDMLERAMDDVYNITRFARDYVATNGPEDDLYVKWFGEGDYIAVMGALDSILYSNKANVTLRCDNPDGNCNNEGWAGHWRGENATQETVICPLSFETRPYLSDFCADDYTVSGSEPSYYWAGDLVHRLYHVPSIADENVGHVADSYEDCLELAHHNSSWTPYNTHTIQYFQLETWANEQSSGCLGDQPDIDHDHDHEESEDGHNHDSDEDSGASTFQGAPIMGTIMASAALLVACAW